MEEVIEAGNKKNRASGFRLKDLVLLESRFERVPDISKQTDIEQSLSVGVKTNILDNVVSVIEKVNYTQSYKEVKEVTCTIVMMGVFEKVGASKLKDLEKFGQINGAAIIFPYIREHLSNLSWKTGLGLVILPPLNFTQQQGNKK